MAFKEGTGSFIDGTEKFNKAQGKNIPGFSEKGGSDFVSTNEDAVKSDHGYNIQSDKLSEVKSDAKFEGTDSVKKNSSPNIESVKTKAGAVSVGNRNNESTMQITSPVKKNAEVFAVSNSEIEVLDKPQKRASSDKKSTYEKDIIDVNFKEVDEGFSDSHESPFVAYDYTDSKGRFINDVYEKGHDKLAYKESSTSAGGGANITSKFTDKGKLVSEIELFKDKERTDLKKFKDKVPHFVEKTSEAFEEMTYDEDNVAASNVDQTAENRLHKKGINHSKTARRYREIQKEAKKEVKELQKEAKREKNDTKIVDDYFCTSKANFTDSTARFTDKIEESFRKDGYTSKGSSIFIEQKKEITKVITDKEKKELDSKKTHAQNQTIVHKEELSKRAIDREDRFLPATASKTEIATVEKGSIESYFSTGENEKRYTSEVDGKFIPDRPLNREDKIEQSRSKGKSAKKEKNKELKKAAAYTAAAKVLQSKRAIQNEIGDFSEKSADDLMKNGSQGLMKVFSNTVKDVFSHQLRSAGLNILKAIIGLISPLIVPIMLFGMLFMAIMTIMNSVVSVFDPDNGSPAYMSYAIPGEYMTDAAFANMMNEAEKYLGMEYVWGGSNPTTGFDCSGFVCWVINNCGNGWNIPRTTAENLRTQVDLVLEDDLHPGDLIFFKGTYNTSGASHVGIVVDPATKTMIHCGNPIQYASYGSNYWTEHFYCYGRVP